MEHGIVTTITYADGIPFCMVQPKRSATEYGPLPVVSPHGSFTQVPNQGDTVMMQKWAGEKRLITGVIGPAPVPPEDMKEGELGFHLDEGTWITFQENNDGNYDLHIASSGELSILSDRGISIEADEDISITTGGDLHLNYNGDLYENGTKQ